MKTASTKKSGIGLPTIFLAMLIAAVFYGALGLIVRKNALFNDFLCFYAIGQQVAAGDTARIHDFKVQFEYQKKLEPTLVHVVPFPRPRFYAEVFRPLANLDLPTALTAWQIVQVLCAFAVWGMLLISHRSDIVLLAAFFFPLPIGIGHGQDSGFMALGAAASLFLFERDRKFASGLALAACLFKWHLILLVGPAMLLGRQWRILAGFTTGAAILLGIDFALDGVGGWQSYFQLLQRTDLDRMTPGLELMPTMDGLFTNFDVTGWSWVGKVLVAGMFLVGSIRLRWAESLLVALTAAILLVPHAFLYDFSTLLYPLVGLLAAKVEGIAKWAGFLVLAPVAYFINAIGKPVSALAPFLLFLLLVGLTQRALRKDKTPGAEAQAF